MKSLKHTEYEALKSIHFVSNAAAQQLSSLFRTITDIDSQASAINLQTSWSTLLLLLVVVGARVTRPYLFTGLTSLLDILEAGTDSYSLWSVHAHCEAELDLEYRDALLQDLPCLYRARKTRVMDLVYARSFLCAHVHHTINTAHYTC